MNLYTLSVRPPLGLQALPGKSAAVTAGLRMTLLLSSLALAGGCAGDGQTGRAAAISRINVVEPGDSTLSCAELTAAVGDLDGNIWLLQGGLADAQSDQAVQSAVVDFTVSSAYQGAYGSIFGPIQSALGGAAQAESQQRQQKLQTQLQNAQQRRDYLAQLYNQRCY